MLTFVYNAHKNNNYNNNKRVISIAQMHLSAVLKMLPIELPTRFVYVPSCSFVLEWNTACTDDCTIWNWIITVIYEVVSQAVEITLHSSGVLTGIIKGDQFWLVPKWWTQIQRSSCLIAMGIIAGLVGGKYFHQLHQVSGIFFPTYYGWHSYCWYLH